MFKRPKIAAYLKQEGRTSMMFALIYPELLGFQNLTGLATRNLITLKEETIIPEFNVQC